jgi:hypothetical protein
MEDDTSGFYAYLEDQVFYAPNFVEGPGFSLYRDNPEDRLRTDTGWLWFDTQEAAYAYYNYTPPAEGPGDGPPAPSEPEPSEPPAP